MRNRPGDSGLVARLDGLQHQINELSRRSTRGPMCVVRLGADVEFPARTDVLISASWNATPDTDTDGMWQYAPGGTERSHLRIPAQGRYLIHFHQQWAWFARGPEDAMLSAKLLRNSQTVAGNAIASTAVVAAQPSIAGGGVGGEGTAVDMISTRPVLDVGDRIYVMGYTQYAWRMLANANGVPTWLAVSYLGPT